MCRSPGWSTPGRRGLARLRKKGGHAHPFACGRYPPPGAVTVVASRRHGAETVEKLLTRLADQLGPVCAVSMGSSLKLCLVAEGVADFYPRLAPTSEWDTAAAQAVVEAAGGAVLDLDLEPMRYNTKEELLNPFFYVVGDQTFAWSTLLRDSASSPDPAE